MNREQIIEYGKMRTNSIYQFQEIIPWKYLSWCTKLKLYIYYKPIDWFKKIRIRCGNEIFTFRNGKLIKTVKDEVIRGKRASLSVVDDWSGINSEVVSQILKGVDSE
jgi:hypothetical protein